jgi:hypothetical protein
MSEFLEIIVPDLEAIDGLSEIHREWAGESFSTDPTRYRYGRLAFTFIEGRVGFARVLPSQFAGFPGTLYLDDELRESLFDPEVNAEVLRDVQQFLLAVTRTRGAWAILYTRDNDQLEVEHTEPSRVAERFQERLHQVRTNCRDFALIVSATGPDDQGDCDRT